ESYAALSPSSPRAVRGRPVCLARAAAPRLRRRRPAGGGEGTHGALRALRPVRPGKRGTGAGRTAFLQRGAPPGGAARGGQVNEAAPARAVRETSWEALTWFNAYRFLVSFLFVALYWIGQLPDPLGA